MKKGAVIAWKSTTQQDFHARVAAQIRSSRALLGEGRERDQNLCERP